MICNYICIWIYNRRGRNHTNLCSCIQKIQLKFASWEEISEKLYIWSHLEWFVFSVKLKDERKKSLGIALHTHTHTQKNCLAWMKKVKFSIHGVCQVLITYIFHSRQNPKTAFQCIVIARCDLTTGVVRLPYTFIRRLRSSSSSSSSAVSFLFLSWNF